MLDRSPQLESCPVALFRKDGRVAVRTAQGGHLNLPTVSLDPHSRPAAAMTGELRKIYGLETVYLWGLPPDDAMSKPVHIAEVREPEILPESWYWMDVRQIEEMDIPQDLRPALDRSHQIATSYSRDYPYAQLGWFDQLLDWASDSLRRRGQSLTGRYSQINGGGAFLARLETEDSAVWFKAPGAVSSIEWSLTPVLAAEAPEWLPEILAIHPQWKGWLAEEVGQSLYHTDKVANFDSAARALAGLQKRFQGRAVWLVSIGVQDQRLAFLKSRIRPFVTMLSELMGMQQQDLPAVLTEANLRFLEERLDGAVVQLEGIGFPDSIIHGDIGPGSIVSNFRRCAFIDWSRIYVGFPPICCELMLNKFAPRLNSSGAWREQLWDSYLNYWPEYRSAFHSAELKHALALVSLMAYVLTKVDIDRYQAALIRPAGAYLRGIARRMFAVAEKLSADRIEVCPYA